ncbi:hypothetical protein H0H93_008993 [Arthromyces matolae]|nr:hypothetical protein H0H93_008993 [Arthromyces matolae]
MAEIVTTKPKPKKEKPPPIEIPPPPPLQPNGRHFMVFGWEFNARDLVGWANHNKVGVGAEDNHKRTLALRTIEKRFRD